MGVYEDNFGFWDIDEPEERAFFERVQRQSVFIACERCQRSVRLIPPKTLCATCVSALECGAPISMKDHGYESNNATGPSSSATTGASFPKWAASSGGGDSKNERMAAQRISSQRPQDHRVRSRSGCDHKGR